MCYVRYLPPVPTVHDLEADGALALGTGTYDGTTETTGYGPFICIPNCVPSACLMFLVIFRSSVSSYSTDGRESEPVNLSNGYHVACVGVALSMTIPLCIAFSGDPHILPPPLFLSLSATTVMSAFLLFAALAMPAQIDCNYLPVPSQ